MVKYGVLFIGKPSRLSKELSQARPFNFFQVNSLEQASPLLNKKPVKVILSDEIESFEFIKKAFPTPVRILLMDKLDVTSTQSAINRGEVFRFILKSNSTKEFFEAIDQGAYHYDLVNNNEALAKNLKVQNRKLETFIEKLEKQVKLRTSKLQNIQEELKSTQRYLEQLNSLIAWINASSTIDELAKRISEALVGVLPIEKTILSIATTESEVNSLKKAGKFMLLMPLVYRKKHLGNLYFQCRTQKDADFVYEKMDFLKQISDTVALTLEKIQIFNDSVQRKEEWQKTFDVIRAPVSLVDQDYNIVRANMAYSKVSEINIQELVGRKCYEVFQKRNSPCDGCTMVEAMEEKKKKDFELKSDSQDTFYATSSFPVKPYSQGHVVLYYRDQGEERRLRYQLIDAEKMAEVGILAGSVAHEINNPLGGIIAFTQILLKEVPKDGSLYQDLTEIESAALRSKNIVENLLMFSRASREEDRRALQIQNVIQKALSLMNLKIRHQNIQVKTNFQDVPVIFGDMNQLVQVFLNVFHNSVQAIIDKKYAKGVFAKIEIATSYEREKKHVRIVISDNGRGISDGYHAQIFDPFFTTKNKSEHPGMGLAVSYQIIQAHGGEIYVKSQLGRGTSFEIILYEHLTGKNKA